MRKNIAACLKAMSRKQPHREATCSTDGMRLYSYAMLIAEYASPSDSIPWVLAYDKAPTATTRSQVSAVRQFFGLQVHAPKAPPSDELTIACKKHLAWVAKKT